MKVLVLGAKGNMGQRYCRILDYLKVKYLEFDQENTDQELETMLERSDGVIVATPTDTHCTLISRCYYHNPMLKFLVEKPLAKTLLPIEILLKKSIYPFMNLTMINQYQYMFEDTKEGKTYYNFFKTGNDGLLWDCISIIALARGEISIKNDSPVWECMINGTKLDRGKVDVSYVSMIRDWLDNPKPNHDYIIEAHKKVIEYAKSIDRNPSEVG